MGIKEILEAKKAKEMAAKPSPELATQMVEDAKEIPQEKTLPSEVKKEEPAIAAPKPLSFAEKMALKRKQEHQNEQTEVELNKLAEADKTTLQNNAASVPQSTVAPAPIPVKEDTKTPVVATVIQNPNSVEEKLRTGVLDATLDKNPMPLPSPPPVGDSVDPAIAQAYVDIKTRIDALNEKSDMEIEGAMSELKKALMANPAACSLMEDTDIGKMVIALRRITGEAIAEAAKEKTPGRKKKEKAVDLSDAAQVAQIFDEL
jgi:hypothetical protein